MVIEMNKYERVLLSRNNQCEVFHLKLLISIKSILHPTVTRHHKDTERKPCAYQMNMHAEKTKEGGIERKGAWKSETFSLKS